MVANDVDFGMVVLLRLLAMVAVAVSVVVSVVFAVAV